jgi:hypothetical protein
MGEAARRHVEQHYTWDRVADLTEIAYFEYLGRETPAGLNPIFTLAEEEGEVQKSHA